MTPLIFVILVVAADPLEATPPPSSTSTSASTSSTSTSAACALNHQPRVGVVFGLGTDDVSTAVAETLVRWPCIKVTTPLAVDASKPEADAIEDSDVDWILVPRPVSDGVIAAKLIDAATHEVLVYATGRPAEIAATTMAALEAESTLSAGGGGRLTFVFRGSFADVKSFNSFLVGLPHLTLVHRANYIDGIAVLSARTKASRDTIADAINGQTIKVGEKNRTLSVDSVRLRQLRVSAE